MRTIDEIVSVVGEKVKSIPEFNGDITISLPFKEWAVVGAALLNLKDLVEQVGGNKQLENLIDEEIFSAYGKSLGNNEV